MARERTYVLRAAAASISDDEVAKMTPEQHRQAFLVFIAGLIGDAERYLARPHVDPIRDGATYNLAGLWLDDGELLEFLRELYTVVQPRLANTPRPGRSRRILATVLLPGEPASESGGNAGDEPATPQPKARSRKDGRHETSLRTRRDHRARGR